MSHRADPAVCVQAMSLQCTRPAMILWPDEASDKLRIAELSKEWNTQMEAVTFLEQNPELMAACELADAYKICDSEYDNVGYKVNALTRVPFPDRHKHKCGCPFYKSYIVQHIAVLSSSSLYIPKPQFRRAPVLVSDGKREAYDDGEDEDEESGISCLSGIWALFRRLFCLA